MYFDLVFKVQGELLPTDHAYPLYAALSRRLPQFHDPRTGWRFAPITGEAVGHGRLRLNRLSVLRVRLPETDIRHVLPLAGQTLDVAGHLIRLGTPRIGCLRPAPELRAWLVTFRNNLTLDHFLATAAEQLQQLGVQGEPQVPVHTTGRYRGQPQRRVIRIKGRTIVGYTLVVSGLPDADSLRLQEHGLGGRTRLGCGFFVPVRRSKP